MGKGKKIFEKGLISLQKKFETRANFEVSTSLL